MYLWKENKAKKRGVVVVICYSTSKSWRNFFYFHLSNNQTFFIKTLLKDTYTCVHVYDKIKFDFNKKIKSPSPLNSFIE